MTIVYKNHTWHQTSILVSWAFCGLGVDFSFFRNFQILNFTILVGKISHICTITVSPIKFWMPGNIGRYRVTCWGPQTFRSSPRNGQLVTCEIEIICRIKETYKPWMAKRKNYKLTLFIKKANLKINKLIFMK